MAERIPPVVRPAGDRQADCRLLRLRAYDAEGDLIASGRQVGGQRECLRQGALTGQPALDRGFAGQEDAGIAALAGQPTVTASLMPFWEYSPRRACIPCCDEGFLRGRQRGIPGRPGEMGRVAEDKPSLPSASLENSMPALQQTISPIDGRIYVERPLASPEQIAQALSKARAAQSIWKHVPVAERAALCRQAIEYLLARKDALGTELTYQMGRPIRYTPREIERMAERAAYMSEIAEASLADIVLEPLEGFQRFIRREPLGVVFAISPWNYPYLTAVSLVVPALLAGNTVLLKHSPQTPLCAERMVEAFAAVGVPEGVFQYLHLSVDDTQRIIEHGDIDFVAFTGSVAVGRAVQRAARERFLGVGLELGGKDPAYVRPDADRTHAIENLVDGAFFNSGQSCCAIERIYVHEE